MSRNGVKNMKHAVFNWTYKPFIIEVVLLVALKVVSSKGNSSACSFLSDGRWVVVVFRLVLVGVVEKKGNILNDADLTVQSQVSLCFHSSPFGSVSIILKFVK